MVMKPRSWKSSSSSMPIRRSSDWRMISTPPSRPRRRQGCGRGELAASLKTRAAQASASGRGYDREAQVIGMLAGQSAELRAADPADRKALAETQQAELKATKDRMLRPTGYLHAVDPLS